MEYVRAELGMHAAAGRFLVEDRFSCIVYLRVILTRVFSTAKSQLGWGLVGYMEADPDLVKEVHGLDIEELRAHEKRMMQHTRCAHPRGRESFLICFS